MRFLMICMQFPTGEGESYLTTELADALVRAGHEVEVLHLDWAALPGAPESSLRRENGSRVVRCTPRRIGGLGETVANASKFVLSGRHAARVAGREFDLTGFDAAIAWMPATAIAPLVPMLRKAGIEHRLLFIWDFFPDHHREIGRIRSRLAYKIAKFWERRLLSEFTAIMCTLPGNADYLRRRYPIREDQRVLVTPVWCEQSPIPLADRGEVRERHGLPLDRPIAVFGGQLTAGRGFEQMLGAADEALAEGSDLLFLFIGEGPFAGQIQERARRQSNILHRPAMNREAYLELLTACDVGMVATVPGVTSFSIPSKTLDYLRAALPVIAAVEHGSDFAATLERFEVGRAVLFDDPKAFRREAERLAKDPDLRSRAREAAPRCLDELFDVRHAVAKIMEAAGARASAEHVRARGRTR